jgi:hypothetical protein
MVSKFDSRVHLHVGEQVTVMAGWKEGREDELVQINGRICLFLLVFRGW